MDLKVDNEDVEKLLEDYTIESGITTEVLQKTIVKGLSSMDRRKNVSISLIRNIWAKWDEVQNFVKQCHLSKTITSRIINIFGDNSM